ncbi:MAG: hypothetical protein WD069_00070 [Planctomycetales bacterium]
MTGIVADNLLFVREIHGTVWHYSLMVAIGVIWLGLIPMQLSARHFRRQLRRDRPELNRPHECRPGRRWLLIGMLGALAPVILIAGWSAWRYLPVAPLTADGPFHGTPAVSVPDHEGLRVGIFGGRTLEVIDPPAAALSPILQLRDRDGTIRWTIHADGGRPGDVRRIRFPMDLVLRSGIGLARSGVVLGEAESTRGDGKMFLFITRDGGLRDYWYAW